MYKFLTDEELIRFLGIENNFVNPFDFGQSTFFTIDALTRFINSKLALEIGTCEGYGTRIMATNCQEVVTVDIHSYREYTLNPQQNNELKPINEIGKASFMYNNVHQLFTDSSNLGRFLNMEFDFIFIDGSHDMMHVKSDTTYAISHIDSPGIIMWHDYTNVPDVTNYLNSLGDPDIYHTGQWNAFKIF